MLFSNSPNQHADRTALAATAVDIGRVRYGAVARLHSTMRRAHALQSCESYKLRTIYNASNRHQVIDLNDGSHVPVIQSQRLFIEPRSTMAGT